MELSSRKLGIPLPGYETFFIDQGIQLPDNFHERVVQFEEFAQADPMFALKFATVFLGNLYVPWLQGRHNEPERFNSTALAFFYKCAKLLNVPDEIVESKEKFTDNLQSVIEAANWVNSLVLLYSESKDKEPGCIIS